jgi:hypothetical protein
LDRHESNKRETPVEKYPNHKPIYELLLDHCGSHPDSKNTSNVFLENHLELDPVWPQVETISTLSFSRNLVSPEKSHHITPTHVRSPTLCIIIWQSCVDYQFKAFFMEPRLDHYAQSRWHRHQFSTLLRVRSIKPLTTVILLDSRLWNIQNGRRSIDYCKAKQLMSPTRIWKILSSSQAQHTRAFALGRDATRHSDQGRLFTSTCLPPNLATFAGFVARTVSSTLIDTSQPDPESFGILFWMPRLDD